MAAEKYMDKEISREARKQYLHYFRFWFLLVGGLAVIWCCIMAVRLLPSHRERNNTQAPEERVYDYAEVLTDQEENDLRAYIKECEARAGMDIVLVTIREDMESGSQWWERSMMEYADDFYDQGNFGYNAVHGDGVLLLDNWYEGQAGSWLSTCGKAIEPFGKRQTDRVLDAVLKHVEENPYMAYRAYVREVTAEIAGGNILGEIPWGGVILLPIFIVIIYVMVHLQQTKARDTTAPSTYIKDNKLEMHDKKDAFIRKNVITRHIPRNTGGGSSGGGGGGRSHTSRGGVSHGGGGRRR